MLHRDRKAAAAANLDQHDQHHTQPTRDNFSASSTRQDITSDLRGAWSNDWELRLLEGVCLVVPIRDVATATVIKGLFVRPVKAVNSLYRTYLVPGAYTLRRIRSLLHNCVV